MRCALLRRQPSAAAQAVTPLLSSERAHTPALNSSFTPPHTSALNTSCTPPPTNSLRILSRRKPPLQPCPQQPPLAPAPAPPRHAHASRCAFMQHLAAERVSRGIPTFTPHFSQSVRVDEHTDRAAPGAQPPRSNESMPSLRNESRDTS